VGAGRKELRGIARVGETAPRGRVGEGVSTFRIGSPIPMSALSPRLCCRLLGGVAALLLAAPGATRAAVSTAIASAATGSKAAPPPIRWNTGGAVWSTSQQAVDGFLATGVVSDRGLAAGLAQSGWPVEELRVALVKPYTVEFTALSRFLYSPEGEAFLREATRSYVPYGGQGSTAVAALRSAILRDGADGSISSVGIMRALPTSFRLADTGPGRNGAQILCARGRCREGTGQCTSLFSWYAFLPACLQARQRPDPLAPAQPR